MMKIMKFDSKSKKKTDLEQHEQLCELEKIFSMTKRKSYIYI